MLAHSQVDGWCVCVCVDVHTWCVIQGRVRMTEVSMSVMPSPFYTRSLVLPSFLLRPLSNSNVVHWHGGFRQMLAEQMFICCRYM